VNNLSNKVVCATTLPRGDRYHAMSSSFLAQISAAI
jgi:hypothetical protein